MAIFVQSLDFAVLYAFLHLWGEVTALKKKKSIYEAFILAVDGFWQVIIRITKL